MFNLTRELYGEKALNKALDRLQAIPQKSFDIDELFTQSGIDRTTLIRTAQKGIEEYNDGLVDLRHGWKPKMMDGSPEEKGAIYGDLYKSIKRMDEFSEPYVSAMRLISDVALRQLAGIATANSRQDIEKALHYQGTRYNFDEHDIRVTPKDGQATTVTERKKPTSITNAYSQITKGFMHLKDQLNLLEDATTPEVYENIRNTNEFPEARIGKCFEAAYEIDRTMSQLAEGFRYLSKKADSLTDKKRTAETLKLLKKTDRSWVTRSTQWYAALQFHEKPWDRAYKASIAATTLGVGGAIYSYFGGYPIGLFFASAGWTIASGTAIYLFTDMGPKTARFLRKLDEKVIEDRWV